MFTMTETINIRKNYKCLKVHQNMNLVWYVIKPEIGGFENFL